VQCKYDLFLNLRYLFPADPAIYRLEKKLTLLLAPEATSVPALAPAAVRTLALIPAPPSAQSASLGSFMDFMASVDIIIITPPSTSGVSAGASGQVRGAALPRLLR
jgi:hypothetical protein